jgi:NTP pyrophosphatase (non-canonical NTP hydrolase)
MKYEREFKMMVDKWGEADQINMCIEELAELIQALSKIRRLKEFPENHAEKKEIYMNNLHEELADALLTTEQIICIFDCQKEVDNIKEQKIRRCMKRYFSGE